MWASIRRTVNVCTNCATVIETSIKICHSLVFPPKTETRAFCYVTSTLGRQEGGVCTRLVGGGLEFTALMLHQCAAVVVVNLQIDQTAEPKGIRRSLISGAGRREPSGADDSARRE